MALREEALIKILVIIALTRFLSSDAIFFTYWKNSLIFILSFLVIEGGSFIKLKKPNDISRAMKPNIYNMLKFMGKLSFGLSRIFLIKKPAAKASKPPID